MLEIRWCRLLPKIKTGSKAVLITAPIIIANIAYFGLPSVRIAELMTVPTITKGKPITMIRPYPIAYGRIFSVAPNSIQSGRKKTNARTAKIRDDIFVYKNKNRSAAGAFRSAEMRKFLSN